MTTTIEPAPRSVGHAPRLSFGAAVGTVFGLEMRQRLRAKGWYWMLGIWFVVIAFIFVLGSGVMGGIENEGGVLFDLVVGFVLLFGLLVAPGLSANAVNGDRAGGTLAILQVTLLTPGQLLTGKWLASWAGSLAFLVLSTPFIFWALFLGGVDAQEAVVSLLMLALELGVVCALGVGISALANRPLFSIVSTYMLVALLAVGTVIVFGLSTLLVMEERTVRSSYYTYPESSFDAATGALDEGAEMECVTQSFTQDMPDTQYITWMLAANPFVVVADAVPYTEPEDRPDDGQPVYMGGGYYTPGVMETVSQQVRAAQAGPDLDVTCEESSGRQFLQQGVPIWPLGLAVQGAIAAGLLFLARRRLTMPAKRLAQGTRIA